MPRLQSASEHGLVSEEAVFNARLLSVARLLLPLPSPDLANPLKSRVTLRPGAVRCPLDLHDGLDPTPAASVLAYTDSCTNATGGHLRTTNPIESTFATVRLRQRRTKGCGSREASLTMVFMLARQAERHWRRLNGSEVIVHVLEGKVFKDGLMVQENAA